MDFSNNSFIRREGVFYPQILKSIKKNSNALQPIFEAFTNALEAILLNNNQKGKITLELYFTKNLLNELAFDKIIIKDTGKGFDDNEFGRFLTFADARKGFNNKGSGRLQLIHFFEKCEYSSVYKESDTTYKKRTFNISKANKYIIENNTITFLKETKELVGYSGNTGTTLTLQNLLSNHDAVNYSLSALDLKEKIVNHYIQFFCLHRNTLPEIIIQQYVNDEAQEPVFITTEDIPEVDKTFEFTAPYKRMGLDLKTIEEVGKEERFEITSYKIDKNKLPENIVHLTSKDEIVELDTQNVHITCIQSKDHVENSRYLFLISSQFLNDRDSDVRGELNLSTKENFMQNFGIFQTEEIFLDDIEQLANSAIIENYPEIQIKIEEKRAKLEELKSMFLLNDDFLKNISITLNDTEESILQKVYIAESKQEAKIDSNIKSHIEKLESLDPTSRDYEDEFNNYIDQLTKEIPLQNRKALTHYVARRSLVLELFNKIINKELKVQNSDARRKNEALIHNMIFKQKSEAPGVSDLWLLNEDFILFRGSSELELKNLKIGEQEIFKSDEELSEAELSFKYSLEQNRDKKRPDVLLFPEEGKCIIIEFKDPDVNIANYLTQIQNYATLIRNFTKDGFQFDTFYGYLLGEKINPFEVDAHDPDFKSSYHFDYLFRPSKTVSGKISNREDGSIYMEILKYSTLYERAKSRNEVFIKKLTEKNNVFNVEQD